MGPQGSGGHAPHRRPRRSRGENIVIVIGTVVAVVGGIVVTLMAGSVALLWFFTSALGGPP